MMTSSDKKIQLIWVFLIIQLQHSNVLLDITVSVTVCRYSKAAFVLYLQNNVATFYAC